ncbi:MAG: hypothetical protein K1563_15295, partial [Candidatus Thiodiazotropha sp. (ex. Lucinisca nassula)]|nr:hypothetical protein [Candidatus Thiodiazotropha sp. (ex. Lucinisca nassula)]MBW9275044.1 hypothetical protein [Candidatus Thiodiazotropha sp. (ex. Lucinisca nassula)]
MNDLDKNPLLEAIPKVESIAEYYDLLRNTPLEGVNIESLDQIERNEYLVDQAKTFEPTAQSLRIAAIVFGMIRSSYRWRNPSVVEYRRKRIGLLGMAQKKPTSIPQSLYGQASTLVVKGVTGTGKSVLFDQLLGNLQQVIYHKEDLVCGWSQCTQITYLKIPMSHDGSRGGFLMNILLVIDDLLKTNYVKDIANSRISIERCVFSPNLPPILSESCHL